jgi:hypothetical protein
MRLDQGFFHREMPVKIIERPLMPRNMLSVDCPWSISSSAGNANWVHQKRRLIPQR